MVWLRLPDDEQTYLLICYMGTAYGHFTGKAQKAPVESDSV